MADVADRLADELGGCLTTTDQHGDHSWIDWDKRRAAEILRMAQAMALESAAESLDGIAAEAKTASGGDMTRLIVIEERRYAARALRIRAADLRTAGATPEDDNA